MSVRSAPLRAQLNVESVMRAGQNALYMKNDTLAVRYFSMLTAARPDMFKPYFFRALARLHLEDWDGAVSDCDTAIVLNPFYSDTYRIRALGWIEKKDYTAAVADYEHVLSLTPRDVNALNNIAICYMRLDNYPRADTMLTRLLTTNTTEKGRIRLMQAECALHATDTVLALQRINESLQLDSLREEPYAMRASIYYRREQWADAESALTRAIDLNHNILSESKRRAEYFVQRALTRYQQWRYDDALHDYDEAVALNPNNIIARYNRGLLLSMVGSDNRAIGDFDFFLRLQPDNETALINRGILRLRTGEYDGAAEDFTAVLNRHPNFIDGIAMRAEAYRGAGKTALAIKDEIQLMKAQLDITYGGNPWRTAGTPQSARKLTDEDIEQYTKMLEEDPERTQHYDLSDEDLQ